MANHVRNALHQLKQGETIGRRETPVISFWPMRPKWIKWGSAWETLGTDGDSMHEDGMLVIPAILRLAYFKLDDQVCQLAYVLHPEVKGTPSPQLDAAAAQYDSARATVPTRMALP